MSFRISNSNISDISSNTNQSISSSQAIDTNTMPSSSAYSQSTNSSQSFGSNEELFQFAIQGDANAIKQILDDNKCDKNAKNANGDTALMLAAKQGHIDVVEILLTNRCNPYIQNFQGNSAIMLAADQGHFNVVNTFLNLGIDPNTQNENGQSSLMLAAFKGHVNIVNILLEKGADLNAVNHEKNTALMLAIQQQHTKVIKRMLEQSEINTEFTVNDGKTTLLLAATLGNFEIVEALVNFRVQTLDGSIYQFNMEATTKDGDTALMLASLHNHPEVVKFLLDKGAKIDIQNNNGDTALTLACDKGHTKVVICLLTNDVDTQLKNKDGHTAAMLAEKNKHSEIIQLLSNHPIKSQEAIQEANIKKVFEHAKQGNAEILGQLLEKFKYAINSANKEGNTVLLIASEQGQLEIVDILIKKGAILDIPNPNGSTALILASSSNHVSTVKLLLEKGANKDACEKSGRTALIAAAQKGYVEVVKILLKHDANAELYRLPRDNALIIAAYNGHADVVDILLAHGVNIDAKNIKGKTAQELAVKKNRVHVIKVFAKYGSHNGISRCKPPSFSARLEKIQIEAPESTYCPLTYGIMHDPITVFSGHTYERVALIQFFDSKNFISKITGKVDICQAAPCPVTGLVILRSELENGTDFTIYSLNEAFVIEQEAKVNKVDVIELLNNNANVDTQDNEVVDEVELLKDVDDQDNEANTPMETIRPHKPLVLTISLNTPGNALLLAVLQGNVTEKDVIALLAKGVDIDLQDDEANTALMLASMQGDIELVRHLLNHGADKEIRNRKNETAMIIAKNNFHKEILELLDKFRTPYFIILKKINFDGEIPAWAKDPYTLNVMEDPVTFSCGFTYDRESISMQFEVEKSDTIKCPMTGKPIHISELDRKTNVIIKNKIESFVSALVKAAKDKPREKILPKNTNFSNNIFFHTLATPVLHFTIPVKVKSTPSTILTRINKTTELTNNEKEEVRIKRLQRFDTMFST